MVGSLLVGSVLGRLILRFAQDDTGWWVRGLWAWSLCSLGLWVVVCGGYIPMVVGDLYAALRRG
jgi:hypothetical protein